jgi:hypothetical protein
VRMGGIDQDMVERDSRCLFDSPGRSVKDVSIYHEHVAGDQGDLGLVRILDDHRGRPELAFLAGGFPRADPSPDHHLVAGFQDCGRGTGFELAGSEILIHAEGQARQTQAGEETVHEAGIP